MKIYIVTDGCYSDYDIVAVYTDREKAERYIATYSGKIEEYETDPETVYPPEGYSFYNVHMLKDGVVVFFGKMDRAEPYDMERANNEPVLDWYPAVYQGTSLYKLYELGVPVQTVRETPRFGLSDLDRYDGAVMWARVLATGEQHAIEIANEKRAVLIASGKWEKYDWSNP